MSIGYAVQELPTDDNLERRTLPATRGIDIADVRRGKLSQAGAGRAQ
jgi:hypothetical protein